ncbi:MAG TPA: DUF533 domain-containing protein [Candidatus Limnocylindrales bacterium]|nr:DUF533 domain-containing protein [Candidatus Limnocylindrales bacterium]
MSIQPQPLSQQEHKAIISICVLAAFVDGAQDEVERTQIERILKGFSDESVDLISVYQNALGGKLSLTQLAADLQSPSAKALAYEMAVCVCHADGVLKDAETKFLAELREGLQLDSAVVTAHQDTARSLAVQPLPSAVPPIIDGNREAELDRLILNAAILNGALEIMPHTLATMAIIPLQMRMVYNIGKQYGHELDRGHIKDFLATVGIGLTSQVFEGFTRRLVGGLARGIAGGLLGGLAGQAAGSAFAFASTYALGQVARRYYASGRTLTTQQLKEAFSSMLDEARSLQGRYSGAIAQKSREVNVSELVPLVRSQ